MDIDPASFFISEDEVLSPPVIARHVAMPARSNRSSRSTISGPVIIGSLAHPGFFATDG
jgi:hypothetical protein